MSEEIQEGQVEQSTEQQSEAPQLNEIEQRALEMGWRPKEEFHGNEEDFIDAKEFVRRKPLFEKIEQIKRSNQHLHQTVNALKEHYTKVEVAAYNRALKELQAKQKAAIREGDLEQYHEIQQEIQTVEDQKQEVVKDVGRPIQNEPPPEFVEWRGRNSWYQSDAGMTHFADELGQKLAAQGMEPIEVLKAVEKKVRETYVHKFQNPNRNRPGAVEGSKGGATQRKGGEYPLSDQERRIMNSLVNQGVLTKEQYIADLKKAKGE